MRRDCRHLCKLGSNGRVNKWRELNFLGKRLAEEFFDRSSESYNQNWKYVKENPVRAGLVTSSDEWLWQEEIESLML